MIENPDYTKRNRKERDQLKKEKCSEIEISEVDPELIFSFLNIYLEKERKNCIKTRIRD